MIADLAARIAVEAAEFGPDSVPSLARRSRLRARMVRLDRHGWWRTDGLPLIAILDGQAVAVLPGRPRRLAPTGQPIDEALADQLDRDAYELSSPLLPDQASLWELLRLGLQDGRRDAVAALMLAMVAAMVALWPAAAGWLLGNTAAAIGPWLVLSACAIILAHALLLASQELAALRLRQRMAVQCGAALWDRVLRLPLVLFRRVPSEKLARATAALAPAVTFMGGDSIAALAGLAGAMAALAAMATLAPLSAAAVAAVLAVGLTATTAAAASRLRRTQIQADHSLAATTFLSRLAPGVPRLRHAGAETVLRQKVAESQACEHSSRRRTARAAAAQDGLLAALPGLAMAAAIFAAPQGDMVALVLLALLGQNGAAVAGKGLDGLLALGHAAKRMAPLFDMAPEDNAAGLACDWWTGAMVADRLCFSYPGTATPIVDTLSLALKPGEIVGISGPSGSGKSTLLRLLLGYEHPDSGRILLDGHDLAELNHADMRSRVGAVLQGQGLSGGVVYRIILGSTPLSLDQAWAAARIAAIAEDIEALGMGMQAVVNDSMLSASQVQRLLIAHAVARQPRLLVLDEATSALDAPTEAKVLGNIRAAGLTCLLVSHRPGTLAHADRVVTITSRD